MESHRLTEDDVFPVCTAEVAGSRPRLRRPDDLRHRPLLTTIGFAEGWTEWFHAARIEPAPSTSNLEFDSMRLALEMAALGHGVALARSSYVIDLLRTRRLRRLFDVQLAATDNLYLTHRRGLDVEGPVARLRDWLLRDRRRAGR
jgi:LysR family glycine cleavage system transcriptional activator